MRIIIPSEIQTPKITGKWSSSWAGVKLLLAIYTEDERIGLPKIVPDDNYLAIALYSVLNACVPKVDVESTLISIITEPDLIELNEIKLMSVLLIIASTVTMKRLIFVVN